VNRSSSVRVGFDVTHSLINATGLGRYPSELRPALEAEDAVTLVPLVASGTGARTTVGRLAAGLRREATYYPAGFARRARQANAELLHCPTVAPVRGGGLPLVMTVHDLLPLRMPEHFTHETRRHLQLSLRSLLGATHVLTNSEWTRGEVTELLGLDPALVSATPFGVHERFMPREVDPAVLRSRFDIGSPYVLTVGTLEPRKNLVAVVRAFERLAVARPDLRLVIVGGRGWRNEDLDALLKRGHDRVHVTGFVSDDELVTLYSGAACFAFPSLAEGFGFPPLEAMACGAPVVSSNRAALPEVVGDAALTVDPTDHDALADAMGRVLDDASLAGRLRSLGLQRSATFTWARCARATLDVYRDVLERTRS
jgi:glycosyltransferase involved in cell wall biosynthesis